MEKSKKIKIFVGLFYLITVSIFFILVFLILVLMKFQVIILFNQIENILII